MPKEAKSVDDDEDRVERIICWLRQNREKILASHKGKLTFDYKGSNVTARHENVQEKI